MSFTYLVIFFYDRADDQLTKEALRAINDLHLPITVIQVDNPAIRQWITSNEEGIEIQKLPCLFIKQTPSVGASKKIKVLNPDPAGMVELFHSDPNAMARLFQ